MGVVVEEMISEPRSEPPSGEAGGGTAPPRDREIDVDRLDYALARRAHRAERLWAD